MGGLLQSGSLVGLSCSDVRVVFLVVSFIYVCLVFCILAHPLVAYDLKWLYGGYWGYQGLLLLCSNMVVYVVCTTVQIGLHKASE